MNRTKWIQTDISWKHFFCDSTKFHCATFPSQRNPLDLFVSSILSHKNAQKRYSVLVIIPLRSILRLQNWNEIAFLFFWWEPHPHQEKKNFHQTAPLSDAIKVWLCPAHQASSSESDWDRHFNCAFRGKFWICIRHKQFHCTGHNCIIKPIGERPESLFRGACEWWIPRFETRHRIGVFDGS